MTKVQEIILKSIKKLGLNKEEYINRLTSETKEIDKQGLWPYFEQLISEGKKYENENNLLVCFLLGLCDEDPVAAKKNTVWYRTNDFPDVDVDYTPEARDAIKAWMAKEFGEDKVVSIASYLTFSLKNALRDVSRVYEVPLGEVNSLTVPMGPMVNKLSWAEACQAYPALVEFEKKYPEVCKIVKLLRGRHRGFGTHAAGVVVSKDALADQVPLIARAVESDTATEKGTKKERRIMSQWDEGSANSNLYAFGYVKFDILGLENLNYISRTMDLIGNTPICRLRGSDQDWTDETYLNDPKLLTEADKANLLTIFQFDSTGIRNLVKTGGVKSFDDLVAYSALYRPGPLQCTNGRNTNVLTKLGQKNIKELLTWHDEIGYINSKGKLVYTKRFEVGRAGKKPLLRIKTKSGKTIEVSPDHRFFKENGTTQAKNLKKGDKVCTTGLI